MYNSGFVSRKSGSVPADEWAKMGEGKEVLECTNKNVALADDWIVVYREGNDQKYGRFMYSESLDQFRSQTMGEFYGRGIVD